MRTTSPSFLIQLLWCQVDSLTVLLRYIRFVKANLQLSNDGIGTRIASGTLLLLPELQEEFHYSLISTHTAPFVAHVPANKSFYTSEDARVHIMSVAIEAVRGAGFTRSYTIAVPNRVLLRYAEIPIKLASRKFSWEEWGPANTRWLEEGHSYAWLRYEKQTCYLLTLIGFALCWTDTFMDRVCKVIARTLAPNRMSASGPRFRCSSRTRWG